MAMGKVVKCQNVDFLTLKSQTLTDLIFKCDLNFVKIMRIHAREVEISQDEQNSKIDF